MPGQVRRPGPSYSGRGRAPGDAGKDRLADLADGPLAVRRADAGLGSGEPRLVAQAATRIVALRRRKLEVAGARQPLFRFFL
jgi:hypothetical protein